MPKLSTINMDLIEFKIKGNIFNKNFKTILYDTITDQFYGTLLEDEIEHMINKANHFKYLPTNEIYFPFTEINIFYPKYKNQITVIEKLFKEKETY